MIAIKHKINVIKSMLLQDGVLDTFNMCTSFLYRRYVRSSMNKEKGVLKFNDVNVSSGVCYLDRLVPSLANHSSYERALVMAIQEFVEEGEDVVIIGGGKGVSSVWAARQVGDGDLVHTYEGGNEWFHELSKTVSLNEVEDIVNTYNNVVGGDSKKVRGEKVGNSIALEEIPRHNTLILDCEGSEIDILSKLGGMQTQKVIVESHGRDGPLEQIRDLLEDSNFEIRSVCPAHGFTGRKEQYVITARHIS